MYQGKSITLTLHDNNIAELIFDVSDSAVNIFNQQTVTELAATIDLLEASSDIKGLMVSSAKKGFIAGADIKEFIPVFSAGPVTVAEMLQRSNRNFNRIEDLPFPVVVAINGFALGGGCEFCLACDYRVAATNASIGLPETRLGLIPGWGGTVRLPRIAGIETAIEWMAKAKEYRALDALNVGVFDGVVAPEKLRDSALKILQQCIDGQLTYLDRREQKNSPLKHNSTELIMSLMTSRAMVAAAAGEHYPAPLAVVDTIEKAAHLDRDSALKIETKAFVSLTQTSVAPALVGIFLNDQLVSKKAKALAETSDKKITKAAVIGAGIMGGGIAYQSALKNIPVKMKDINQAGIDLGLSEANKLLGKRVDRGRLSVADMGAVLNRIEPTLSYDGFQHVDLVVEAVVENAKIKHSVLAELEQQVGDDTIITSNTSTISIDYLASCLQRPENFCGMHFFNPVSAMPLVEVIRGSQTSEATIARTVAYATAMGKKAIVVEDCPGFLVNRVLFPYLAGFAMLLRDGADFQQVDKVMTQWGWPMGPAHLIDVVGIDTAVHAEKVMIDGFPKRMQRDFTSAPEALLAAERLGQKNNKGFYDYGLDRKGRTVKVASDDAYALLKPLVASGKEFTDDEIIARMMIPMMTELARCLEEGIVASAAEADMALVYGVGLPPFRGGLFRWLDTIGLDTFNTMSEPYQTLSPLYLLTDGMQAMLADQTKYYPL